MCVFFCSVTFIKLQCQENVLEIRKQKSVSPLQSATYVKLSALRRILVPLLEDHLWLFYAILNSERKNGENVATGCWINLLIAWHTGLHYSLRPTLHRFEKDVQVYLSRGVISASYTWITGKLKLDLLVFFLYSVSQLQNCASQTPSGKDKGNAAADIYVVLSVARLQISVKSRVIKATY